MTACDTDPVTLRGVAEALAVEAAGFVRRRRVEVFDEGAGGSSSGAVGFKSTRTDPVTIVDTETERLLRERLAQKRPGERVLGEEQGGPAEVREGRLVWVLDPIDGTVNFVYGLPAYAVSVAAQFGGVSVAGAVADVPSGTVYSAALGQGALVRQGDTARVLRCSGAGDLAMSLVGTGFAYAAENRLRQAEILTSVLPRIRDVRRMGSCALDLCMVAAGHLDGYYEDGVHVWDWAAAALIAAEAGAMVSLPPVEGPGLVVAAAPGIADALADALAGAGVDLRQQR